MQTHHCADVPFEVNGTDHIIAGLHIVSQLAVRGYTATCFILSNIKFDEW